MAKYDIEGFLIDLQTYLQANLNTQITVINTEKGDSLLEQIDSSAYAILTIEDKHLNYNPFITITIDDIDCKGAARSLTPKKYEVSISLCFQAQNDDHDWERSLRYQRSLEDLFNNGYNSVAKHVNYTIESLLPISIKFLEKPAFYRAVGVSISLTIPN